MKKISMIAIAVAMTMTLLQCKKTEETKPISNGGEKVSITLDVNNGSRVVIYPETGAALFEDGDVVYVANNGKYVGTLTYNLGLFGGEITSSSEDDFLHFYFMGNKIPVETLDNTTSTLTVNISDQTSGYPEIAYAPSAMKYSSSVSAYHARLLNKCALVKFDITTASSAAICVTGMNNEASVNLGTNVFSYSKEGEGIIKFGAGNGEKWAILLPQGALATGEEGSAYSDDGTYIGTRAAIPAIAENGYLTSGIAVTVNTLAASNVPTGAINGLFTINSNGDQVYFSKGNLQYQPSTDTWRFAENQSALLVTPEDMTMYQSGTGFYYADVSSQYISSYEGWIDLFGWGTSGFNNIANDEYAQLCDMRYTVRLDCYFNNQRTKEYSINMVMKPSKMQ